MRKLNLINHLTPQVPKLGILTSVEQLTSFDMIYIYHHLFKGAQLELRRELNHYLDKNAVQVYYKGFKLGYLSSSISTLVAPRIDNGIEVKASVKSLGKSKYMPLKSLDVELHF